MLVINVLYHHISEEFKGLAPDLSPRADHHS
jgi:hypothetical protein